MREEQLVGLRYLQAVTTLLQRVRSTHPTKGLFEAADLQWWWRSPRSTDDLPQLFWFNEFDHPEAAVIAIDWGDAMALAVMIMPDATPAWVAHVVERGLSHAAVFGSGAVDLEVDRTDEVMRDVLVGHGFTAGEEGRDGATASHSVVEAWLDADERPGVSPLHADYRLSSRLDTMPTPHHMIKRGGPDVEERLAQTSLYRPDLDLIILDPDDAYAAYGLFWYDPETASGLVEPMRTEEDHQQRGLARHLITTGIDLLVEAGAKRIKICFEPHNPAARGLYLSVGFQPVKETVVFSRSAGVQTS